MDKPRFEKVDLNTIKIIVEHADNVPLFKIVENKKKLLAQKAQIEQTLKHIDEILDNAKRLGIVAKEPANITIK